MNLFIILIPEVFLNKNAFFNPPNPEKMVEGYDLIDHRKSKRRGCGYGF